jgi:hypothetical protein
MASKTERVIGGAGDIRAVLLLLHNNTANVSRIRWGSSV